MRYLVLGRPALAAVLAVALWLLSACGSALPPAASPTPPLATSAPAQATEAAETLSPTPAATATPTVTATASATPSLTASATPTAQITPSPSGTKPPTAAPSPSPNPVPQPTSIVVPVHGEVTLTTDKADYKAGETVVVTLGNGLGVSIFGLTGRTYCSIVSLERKEGNGWQEQGKCLVSGPPGWIEIRPGTTQAIQLAPGIYEDVPLPAGVYRAVFPYKLGSTSGSDSVSYAPEFVVSP